MTILKYSNASTSGSGGGGGGYRHHRYHRDGGQHVTSQPNKWKRPPAPNSSITPATIPQPPDAVQEMSSDSIAAEAVVVAKEQDTKQPKLPILRGGPKEVVLGKNAWKRTGQTTVAPKSPSSYRYAKEKATHYSMQPPRHIEAFSAQTAITKHSWKRPHVEKTQVKTNSTSTATNATIPAHEDPTISSTVQPQVTLSQSTEVVVAVPPPIAQNTTLRKVGHGKLVRMAKSTDVTAKSAHPPIKKGFVSKHQRKQSAKRIQLAEKVDKKKQVGDGANSEDSSDNGRPSTTADHSAGIRLTDHAYRSNQKGMARSLVRVPMDETKTRVCPTVFQGRRCTDPKCRKRHDVAQQCAVPLCTFFQKTGLGCRVGDSCPFLHVKVDARTPVCSNFARLGFCQDALCALQHLSK
jgi:Zinc finger C-x8-C-x5-C-x3-H type (and similar)